MRGEFFGVRAAHDGLQFLERGLADAGGAAEMAEEFFRGARADAGHFKQCAGALARAAT